ncbi:polynucleotide 5'-hydroxyl-kinase NOL9 [Mercurialis annua]|uniref:polynucleotide 5'-hydroxyl-kinase NOL9 n=1 Tax=Mercurialis annua TaxID=3986 RepID=UPI00215E0B79|nr:polynucleotide 5'-hydroxyl-kinase NOL9 [Mercurialis annua]
MAEAEEEQSPSIHIPQQWSDAANSIAYDSSTSPPPIVVVCGARNCGKTTFSRYLLNTLLHRYRKVGYLDTDVGQPEFTTPGFVSLTIVDQLTSDLTIPCLKTPDRCLFFGDVSSKRDPGTYLKCIFALCGFYWKEYRTSNNKETSAKFELPLVVNTPGWVKGVGYDTLVDMVKCISPTHVVKINVSSERKNLPEGAFWLDCDSSENEEVYLIEINSARQESFKKPALMQKDARFLRDLRLMAYFRQCIPSSLNLATIKELANALASHPPYQVPISSIKIKHLHCQVPHAEIFYSLNASIVGLAVSSEQIEDLPWCVGLGIVRGIDTLKGVIYMLTPVPPSILEKVDLLLQGSIQIPTCLLQAQGCMSPYMSANVIVTQSS